MGSIRLVVNASSGQVAQQLTYDEFGRVLSDSSPGFQPFGFAGGLYDADTGLVRFGARDYDAESGRWTSKDPILFGSSELNLYAYVGNDPINRNDSSGQIWPYEPIMCTYYTSKLADAAKECDEKVTAAWSKSGDEGLEAMCSMEGGSPSDQYINCLIQNSGGVYQKMVYYCSKTAVGAGTGKSPGGPSKSGLWDELTDLGSRIWRGL